MQTPPQQSHWKTGICVGSSGSENKECGGESSGGEGYSHTLPIWVCTAQRGRDFEAPDLEWGIHFRGVF